MADNKGILRLALAGNPNSGKTTLFNRLTGFAAPVGNWPGVTVEKLEGTAVFRGKTVKVTDLPGIYSLIPYSSDEAIAGGYLKKEKPDLIIDVVDASNLERNLYLTTQLMELNIPMVIALSMSDTAKRRGILINCERLSLFLGIKAVPIRAADGTGINSLMEESFSAAGKPPRFTPPAMPSGCADKDLSYADARYKYIRAAVSKSVKFPDKPPSGATDKIDAAATNRFLAFPVFFAIMAAIFIVTFGPPGEALVALAGRLLDRVLRPAAVALLNAAGAGDFVKRLVLGGVFAGISSVVKFLPQIALLFLLTSFLEDSGYMARAAFIMDAPMRRIGLSGRAFVPLLMGFGCTVPAVMGTRILENEKDKRLTVLAMPFMSCSAKLPVYSLIISAFFAGRRPAVMLALYLSGIVLGILSSVLLKNCFVKGPEAPFVMELPDYRMPSPRGIAKHTWERVKNFLKRAGTTVFAATVIIWLLQSVTPDFTLAGDSSQSILAYAGRAAAPVFTLCGFGSWQPAVALLAGLTAKESIAGTLGVLCPGRAIYSVFTPASAFSYMLFVLLYTPCTAALTAIHKETGSLKLTLLCAFYQFAAAWYVSAMFYQSACLFT